MNGRRKRERETENGNLRCAASRSNNLNRRFFRASSALPRDQKSMTFQDTRVVLSLRSLMLSFFFYIYGTRSRGTVIFIPRSQLYFSTGLFLPLV